MIISQMKHVTRNLWYNEAINKTGGSPMATKKIPVIYDDENDPIPATQMSQEQLNEHRNYYTFERAPSMTSTCFLRRS
jgi:hypothetical protein